MDLRRTARALPERLVALGILCFAPMAALSGAALAADLLVGTDTSTSIAAVVQIPPL